MPQGSLQEAVAKIKALPALPSVLAQILRVVGDPDASALELGRHIAADQSLSASLLRVVNSAAYGYYRKVETVPQAIVILGFYEVRNLILAAVAFRTFPAGHRQYDRTQLWRHSLVAAIATERIVKTLRLPVESAFVAGLLHDIGKVILDVLYPDRFHECATWSQLESRPIQELEKEAFSLDHAAIGALLARQWDLPPALVAALEWHHAVPGPDEAAARLVSLTALGDYIAYQAGFGESSNGKPPELPPEYPGLAIGDDLVTAIIEDMKSQSANIDELLGALTE
jgi:putative nucleotidyltransferase with HDIG domain